MKKTLTQALKAKRRQRAASARQSVAQKLAIVERLRERKTTISGRHTSTRDSASTR